MAKSTLKLQTNSKSLKAIKIIGPRIKSVQKDVNKTCIALALRTLPFYWFHVAHNLSIRPWGEGERGKEGLTQTSEKLVSSVQILDVALIG